MSSAFARATSVIHLLLVTEAAFVLATLPGAIGMLLLARDPSNIPLFALCALPFGPALTAALGAVAPRDDPAPWRDFWRAWREGLGQSLAVWAPAVALAGVAGFNAAFGGAAGVDPGFVIAGVVLAAGAVLLAVACLVVVSAFRFRAVDVPRVALWGLGAAPWTGPGLLSLAVLAAAVSVLANDFVLLLLAALFAVALRATCGRFLRVIRERFTAPG